MYFRIGGDGDGERGVRERRKKEAEENPTRQNKTNEIDINVRKVK
jgi:hypothetical protein